MQIIKYLILLLIFVSSTYIGILVSKKYKNRVRELKQMKNALAIFATQINFTYEPIPEIFIDISKKINSNMGEIFKIASKKMEEEAAGIAWKEAIEENNTNLNKEDKDILKNLGNLLGKVDIDGQIKEIELVNNFIDNQIEKAEQEKRKNEKMYKTLGITIGLAMVIILI